MYCVVSYLCVEQVSNLLMAFNGQRLSWLIGMLFLLQLFLLVLYSILWMVAIGMKGLLQSICVPVDKSACQGNRLIQSLLAISSLQKQWQILAISIE